MADLDTFNQGEAQEEPGFLDKLTGVFASPGATFEAISNYPPRIKDWLVPLVITIIFALLSNFLIMKNAVLREQAIEMQMKAVRESLSEQVEKGILTQKQADQQLNRTSEFFESNSGSGMALQMIGTVFSMFIIFFIVSLFYFLVVKIGLKGTGTYTAAMTAYGLPYYIVALKLLMIILLSFATHRIFTNASIGSALKIEPDTFAGFLANKLDIFSIWMMVVLGISFSKMFKSDNSKKYIITFISIWLGFGILLFLASKSVSWLKWFALM